MLKQLTLTQQKKLRPLGSKKILLLGAAREGLSTYNFLRQNFPKLRLTLADCLPRARLSPPWQNIIASDPYLTTFLGKHYLNALTYTHFNYLFKTPGIPATLPPLLAARQNGTHFTSNVEWFMRLARGHLIGVTGTKGKSTTSSLIAHTFTTAGHPTLLLGNIGTAPLSQLTQTTAKTITVLELSAHQLQDLPLSPHFAVLQNITSEHLDYYSNTKAYVNAKTALVRFQKPSDYLIYSDDFPTSRHFATLTPAHKLCFGLKDKPHHLAFANSKALFYRPAPGKLAESSVALKKVKLLGKHNLYNLLPALILAQHFQLPPAQIQAAFASFTPLRHRLEFVATLNQVSYYNDSLSTTPEATIAALKTFAPRPLHLLAGGFERHQDYTKLAQQILKSNVKSVILFPPTGTRLRRTLIDLAIKKKLLVPDFYPITTMTQAVRLAHQLSTPGDLVLLSPAAASFGSFKDYADRGDQFCHALKKIV